MKPRDCNSCVYSPVSECEPPQGLRPRFMVAQERMTEIMEAITRYTKRQWLIPIDWVNEYNELAENMKKALQ